MGEPITVEGFVVVYGDDLTEAVSRFSRTAGGAWGSYLPASGDLGEDAARRQRAMNKGFRLRRATLTILPEDAPAQKEVSRG